jgi:hypothetical protein
MARHVPLPTSTDESIVRISSALDERGSARTGGRLPSAALPKNEAARRFWSERTWSEFAAVPAMAHMSLAAAREGLSLTVLDTIAQIGRDEVRHTSLSRDLADSFGGYLEDIPDEVACDPQSIAEPSGGPLAGWTLSAGCISETISFELMRTRMRYTSHPLVRSVLQGVFKDEAMHSRFSWALARELLPTLDQDVREAMADYAAMQLDMLKRVFGTSGLPEPVRSQVRAMRSEVASLGLGAAPPEAEDATVERVSEELIIPRLRKLGIPIP